MKDILNDLLGLNLVLKLQKYGFQLQVTVSTDDYKYFTQQLLPRDNHMDYALEGCIKFCMKHTIQKRNNQENGTSIS
jgi:hypothetical protein